MNKLYVLVGLPGSGKSTFAKDTVNHKFTIVSRDTIRFNKLNDNDRYFDKEKEVFNEFVEQINKNLKFGHVIADATHISKASRAKLLSRVTTECKVVIALIDVDYETALLQNNSREGVYRVPETAIAKMRDSFEEPSFDEDERIETIMKVKPLYGVYATVACFRDDPAAVVPFTVLPRNAKIPTKPSDLED